MKIKKYIAKSLKEGKAKVLSELGEDAVILSSRSVKLPESEVEAIEILAAIDEKSNLERQNPVIKQRYNSHQNANLKEIDSESLIKLSNKIEELSEIVKYKHSASLGETNSQLYKILIKSGIEENEALSIVGRVSAQYKSDNLQEAIINARKIVIENIKINPQLKISERNLIYFVGASGSGKTTTLIKVAVICKLLQNANVLIISADTHKVGGSEQLQTYSSIANIPFYAVYNRDELDEVITKEADRDYIFVDTSGKNFKEEGNLLELKSLISEKLRSQKLMTISATENHSFLKSNIDLLKQIGIDSIIITKADEAINFGDIYNTLKYSGLGVSYITNGLKVPDDIEPASKITLSKMIISDKSAIS